MQVQDIESKIVLYPDGRMDTANAALYMGLSEKTLAMMRCKGNGPKFIKRGKVFYFKSDVDEWINTGDKYSSTTQARFRRVKK